MADPLTSMNVSLPESLREFVQERLGTAGFANASEYVRHLIRQDRDRVESRLAELIEEGLDSGAAVVADDRFWAGLDRRVEARVAQMRRGKRAAG
ncbi:MAG: hypothetical protein R3B68_07280 [Phycisphaerales bacterium]